MDFDWLKATEVVLTSRAIDELEEKVLGPQGSVTYQFSAKGHELAQALIGQLLDYPFDAAAAYYRSRPLMLGLGLTIEEAIASDMAKKGSLSGGRDVGVVFNMPKRGKATVLPAAGDVGSQYSQAAGWAQAIRYRVQQLGQDELEGSIVVAFGGDGSVATNGFWSCLSMITTLRLPVLLVIEDNGYAISVRRELQTPGGNIAANLSSFTDLQVWDGSGTNPQETAGLISSAVDYVRQGQGAALLRLTMPRLSGHSSMDNQAYKSEETVHQEQVRDPLRALRDHLVPGLIGKQEWSDLERSIKAKVEVAAEKAANQPQPDPYEVTSFVFSNPELPQQVGGLAAEGIRTPSTSALPKIEDPRRINMVEAIRRTLESELAANPRCLVFGEDVAQKGGVHTATMGLLATFGDDRVFDTGLSEEGIVGRAVGMALAGLVPIPEIQFRKYADPATEQINNCGSLRWRTNNRFAAPMVIRMAGGYGRKVGDPWHSVTNEAFFAHAVGWQVAFPSNTTDAVGLLRSAVRGNDPVIFFEHRALLDGSWSRRPYPGDGFAIPFGKANIIRNGSDLTVVTWGAMVEKCELVAKSLSEEIEIIDLRTIVPWDRETVLDSVKKTSKCLIVHEDIGLGGFGAEISATVAEEAFMDLDGPIVRIAAPSIPVPFNYNLMEHVVPSEESISEAMKSLLAF